MHENTAPNGVMTRAVCGSQDEVTVLPSRIMEACRLPLRYEVSGEVPRRIRADHRRLSRPVSRGGSPIMDRRGSTLGRFLERHYALCKCRLAGTENRRAGSIMLREVPAVFLA
jgi:hypothetical protein